MGGGVGERADYLEQLDHGAGPAVGDDQRQRVLVLGAGVDEVDLDAVDLGRELRQRVQPLFDPPEVVLARPVVGERPERRELNALGAVVDQLLARPARGLDAAPQVVDLLGGDLDLERPDPGLDNGAHEAASRSDANADRSSREKISGSSHAAK
jgi:hypothetical protein